jgi:hypothetical protein
MNLKWRVIWRGLVWDCESVNRVGEVRMDVCVIACVGLDGRTTCGITGSDGNNERMRECMMD